MKVWTVGHSTHSFDAFTALLAAHDIALLADIRTVPKSRRHPHFHADALARSLPDRGVAYLHLPRLGGFRRPRPDSPNGAWRNESFRGYADYAMGDEFAKGLAQLRELAAAQPGRDDVFRGAVVALPSPAGGRSPRRRRRHGLSHRLGRARVRASADVVCDRRCGRAGHVPGGLLSERQRVKQQMEVDNPCVGVPRGN